MVEKNDAKVNVQGESTVIPEQTNFGDDSDDEEIFV